MLSLRRPGLIRCVVICSLLTILLPASAMGTMLFGHPYACYYNRESGSAWFDTGIVFMWNGTSYVGSATISSLATGGFFAVGCWESLRDAMYTKKFTILWTDAGPHTNVNDLSQGELDIFVVTIF